MEKHIFTVYVGIYTLENGTFRILVKSKLK